MTDDRLIPYVMGDATKNEAQDIEARAAVDPELAAEIAVLRSLVGSSEGVETPTQTRQRLMSRFSGWPRRVVVGLFLMVCVSGVAWAGYLLIQTPPLFADDFSSGTIKHQNWKNTLA